jgi:hypothetical protein
VVTLKRYCFVVTLKRYRFVGTLYRYRFVGTLKRFHPKEYIHRVRPAGRAENSIFQIGVSRLYEPLHAGEGCINCLRRLQLRHFLLLISAKIAKRRW